MLPQSDGPHKASARKTRAIRVLLVDDHPALRAGLQGVLEAEPGVIPVGTVEHALVLWPALTRLRPDVVVMDYALAGSDGLTLCFEIKVSDCPPAVLLYSAYADPSLAVPGMVAQADGLINKAAPVSDLLSAIRRVERGEIVMPALPPDLATAASARFDNTDTTIMGLLLKRTPVPQVADTLRVDAAEVVSSGLRIISRLQATTPGRR